MTANFAPRPANFFPGRFESGPGFRFDAEGLTLTGQLDYGNVEFFSNLAAGNWDLLVQRRGTDEFRRIRLEALGLNASAATAIASAALLRALVPKSGAVAALTAGGREGLFGWFSGDFTLGITSDPLGGVYIKSDAVAASDGAWVRLGSWATDGVAVSWFGLNYADDTAAIQAALNFASNLATKRVLQGSQQLTFSSTLAVPAGVKVVGNRIGAWRQANGKNLAELVVMGSGAEWIDAGLDGNWANNPTVSPSRVGIRIGLANDVVVSGGRLSNFAGFPIVLNGGKRNKITGTSITNFYNVGIQIFGADGYDENLIDDNRIIGIGWGGINVANSSGNIVSNNRVTGLLVGGPGARLTVNTSGSTVTWVSGPKFTFVRAGNFVTLNNGAEFRVGQVVSDTVLTVEPALPALTGAQASVGAGDLTGVVQGSYNKVHGNIIKDCTTYGFGYSLGVTNAGALFNEFYDNTIINAGKNAICATGQYFGGGGFLEGNVIADNKIVSAGVGGGIAPIDRIAILLVGDHAGGLLSTHIRGNSVHSFGGDGQTTYWLGTDGHISPGAVIAQSNQAVGMANEGISLGLLSITPSSHWGSGAVVSGIQFDGRAVRFTLTAAGTGRAAGGSFTISKAVEASASQPSPTAKVVSGSGYIPQMWGEAASIAGTWTATQLDNLIPAEGQSFLILMKD